MHYKYVKLEELYYIIEVIVDYRLSTVDLKKLKTCIYKETLKINYRNRFEY